VRGIVESFHVESQLPACSEARIVEISVISPRVPKIAQDCQLAILGNLGFPKGFLRYFDPRMPRGPTHYPTLNYTFVRMSETGESAPTEQLAALTESANQDVIRDDFLL
jgi:hypothetical protein